MNRRRWLRLLGLFVAVEGSLRLFGACRPCTDWRGGIDRSAPLLARIDSSQIAVVKDGLEERDFHFFIDPDAVQKLNAALERATPPRGASRTRAGQLLDDHGRVLLDSVGEGDIFAYSPERDLLVWGSDESFRLNIRSGSAVRTISTWSIKDVQIRSDGTIWLLEEGPWLGIAALDQRGRFLGWRVYGCRWYAVDRFAEADDADRALVERLLARGEKKGVGE